MFKIVLVASICTSAIGFNRRITNIIRTSEFESFSLKSISDILRLHSSNRLGRVLFLSLFCGVLKPN